MRKKLLRVTALSLSFFLLVGQVAVASPEKKTFDVQEADIAFDQESFEQSFALLNELESTIKTEGIKDYEALKTFDVEGNYTDALDVSYSVNATQRFDWANFDWGSALWGFLCCPIGFFVVITNKNKTSDQKVSFWIGFAAGVVLNAITYPLVYRNYTN
jgi:uncharacterized membrane protein